MTWLKEKSENASFVSRDRMTVSFSSLVQKICLHFGYIVREKQNKKIKVQLLTALNSFQKLCCSFRFWSTNLKIIFFLKKNWSRSPPPLHNWLPSVHRHFRFSVKQRYSNTQPGLCLFHLLYRYFWAVRKCIIHLAPRLHWRQPGFIILWNKWPTSQNIIIIITSFLWEGRGIKKIPHAFESCDKVNWTKS